MSYSEQIQSKNLEVFKSIPWGKPKGTEPDSGSDEQVKRADQPEFASMEVTAFKDSINWHGKDSAATPPAAKPANDDPVHSSKVETNKIESNFNTDEALFSDTEADDFGLEAIEEAAGSQTEYATQKQSDLIEPSPKLAIRSNTRSDSHALSELGNNKLETDLQRIAVLLLSRKNSLTLVKALGLVAVLVGGVGLWNDYAKLGVAQSSSNPNELRAYLDSQFTHIWDTDIRLRLNDMEDSTYQQAIASGEMADYRRYLRDFPNGRYFDEIIDLISTVNHSQPTGEVQ